MNNVCNTHWPTAMLEFPGSKIETCPHTFLVSDRSMGGQCDAKEYRSRPSGTTGFGIILASLIVWIAEAKRVGYSLAASAARISSIVLSISFEVNVSYLKSRPLSPVGS